MVRSCQNALVPTATEPQRKRNAVVVTGATGYVGSHLVATLLARGYRVHALARRPDALPAHENVVPFAYALHQPPDDRAFVDACAIVHAAADMSSRGGRTDAAEEGAAAALCDAAERFGIARLMYISSLQARADARSAYGRLKWRIESAVRARGGMAVRLGLVYGGASEGLFGTMDALARHAPALPVFVPSPRVQPLHIDDLCNALANLLDGPPVQGVVYALGEPSSVTLGKCLRELAWCRHRRLPVPVPVPLALVRLAAWLCSHVPVLPGWFSVRLDGLAALSTKASEDVPTQGAALGVEPRTLAAGLGPGRRRELLEEGLALLRYVSGATPPGAAIVRYAKALATHAEGCRLPLPRWCLAWPCALRLVDPRNPCNPWQAARKRELARRLDIAVALAETDPALAASFRLDGRSAGLAALGVAGQLLVDGLAAILSFAIRLVRLAMRLGLRSRGLHVG